MQIRNLAVPAALMLVSLGLTGCETGGLMSGAAQALGQTYDDCVLRHLGENPSTERTITVTESCRRQFEREANIALANDQGTMITDPQRTDRLMRISVTNPSDQIVTRVAVILDFYDGPISRNALGEVQQNRIDTVSWTFNTSLDPDGTEVFTGTFGAKPPPNTNWVARAVGIQAMAARPGRTARRP